MGKLARGRPQAGKGAAEGGAGTARALALFTQNTRRSRELAAERVGALSVARRAAGDV